MMKKEMKLITLVIVCMLVSVINGCSIGEIQIPDIINTDEDTAKNILSSNGLIPTIEYEYDEETEKGKVFKVVPEVSEKVKKNSKVSIYISKGPKRIESKSSYGEWTFIGSNKDDWQFSNPYINDGVLYIDCYNVVFGTSMMWKDRYQEGKGYGEASVNDTFDKVVPIKIDYEKQQWNSFESQRFVLEVPLNDLGVDKPTDLYFRLAAEKNGVHKNILVNFSISW